MPHPAVSGLQIATRDIGSFSSTSSAKFLFFQHSLRQNCETHSYLVQTVAFFVTPFAGKNNKILRDVPENNPISLDFQQSKLLTGQHCTTTIKKVSRIKNHDTIRLVSEVMKHIIRNMSIYY
jgi:hypothetical protein